MAASITNEIADIASLLNTDDFSNCMMMLKSFKSHLVNGTKFQTVGNHESSAEKQNSPAPALCDPSQNMPSTSEFTGQSGIPITSECPDSNFSDSEIDSPDYSNQQSNIKSIKMPQIRK
jgi:hypothetical protein